MDFVLIPHCETWTQRENLFSALNPEKKDIFCEQKKSNGVYSYVNLTVLPSSRGVIFSVAHLLEFHVYRFLSSFVENIFSEELPFLTDRNLNSCEIINNSEPLRRKFIDVILEKNCPSQDPITLTIKFRNVKKLGLIKEELVLYSKTVGTLPQLQ